MDTNKIKNSKQLTRGQFFYGLDRILDNKQNKNGEITVLLIKEGFQQPKSRDGYTKTANDQGLQVDYRLAEPSQYWHLENFKRHSYELAKKNKNIMNSGFSIRCGEFIFWIAEITEAVPKDELFELAKIIVGEYKIDENNFRRKAASDLIKSVCWGRIVEKLIQVD